MDGKDYFIHEILGYLVMDANFGEVGKIEDVIKNPMQSVFVVMHHDKEVLIPAIDEIIINIDKEKRIVNIMAPDGLIDLYI